MFVNLQAFETSSLLKEFEMNASEELSFAAGEKSMSFLPLDVMTDQYAEPRIESYCTLARIRAANGTLPGELELHHHLIVDNNWCSHTIESYTYYVREGSLISMQDAETGERHDLKITFLGDNKISFLVL